MAVEGIAFQLNLPTLGAIAASAWFIWQRYQSLEARLDAREDEVKDLKHNLHIFRQACQSNEENLKYLINNNSGLIQHRTDRFCNEIERLEGRLGGDIADIKKFLAKSTEFKIRE